jgi:hypothetical protein
MSIPQSAARATSGHSYCSETPRGRCGGALPVARGDSESLSPSRCLSLRFVLGTIN